MPKTHSVSIRGDELIIDKASVKNNIQLMRGVEAPAFKTGVDRVSEITFDEKFWKQCFTGDSVKDGTSKSTQQSFLKPENGWTDELLFSGDEIKKVSSQMVDRLYAVNMIFMAELLRFKGYKDASNVPEALKTQFASAFPERTVYVNKDSGLDTDIVLGLDKSMKSCNIATDIIDPHSSSVDDCKVRFPASNDTIDLDKSVFNYLQYPDVCALTSKTLSGKGKYESTFTVAGEDLMENEAVYFAGNKTKNASMKSAKGTKSGANEALKLCIGKYSGDTLQSLIQRLFELIDKRENCAYTISTCDSIVSLRSYALNGSFIEVYTEKENKDKKKVTKIYVWRQDLSSPTKLMEIFVKEKERIILEYETFINVIQGIRDHYNDAKNTANNIVIMGSGTTYRFDTGFYDHVIADLRTIVGFLTRFGPDANPDANMLGQFIRDIRTYKVNDFFKINGKGGKNYCMSMAAKYTKGDLTALGGGWSLIKRPTETFFDAARTKHSYKKGGSQAKETSQAKDTPPAKDSAQMKKDVDYYINTYFENDYYKKNPCIFIQDDDGDNQISYDLHKEFLRDFAASCNKIIRPFIKKTNQGYDTVFFECFCDVINSFAILDKAGLGSKGYYHPDSIDFLCTDYIRNEEFRLDEEAKVAKAEQEARDAQIAKAEREAKAEQEARDAQIAKAEREAKAEQEARAESKEEREQLQAENERLSKTIVVNFPASRKRGKFRKMGVKNSSRKISQAELIQKILSVGALSKINSITLNEHGQLIKVGISGSEVDKEKNELIQLGISGSEIGRLKGMSENKINRLFKKNIKRGSFGGAKTRKNRK
jgi:hypothetical protein